MIKNVEILNLNVAHAIFHDIPRNLKGTESSPILSDIETKLSAVNRKHLSSKVTKALISSGAYPIEFRSEEAHAVQQAVHQLLNWSGKARDFVLLSHKLGLHLHKSQTGASSPGLLSILLCTSKDDSGSLLKGLILLKLEREEGAQLLRSDHDGKKTFDMNVLADLVLTQKTRAFKTVFFLQRGQSLEEINILACDSQRGVGTPRELARFWLNFLGCKLVVEPRIATKQFYEAVIKYVNSNFSEATEMATMYEHLGSQLKSNHQTLLPMKFIEEYVPLPHRDTMKKFLLDQGISMHEFEIETSEIANRLKRKAFHTKNGADVSVPIEFASLVTVEETKLTIEDAVVSVDKK